MIGSIFTILLALGVPIAFVLGISSFIYLWKTQMPSVLVAQRAAFYPGREVNERFRYHRKAG
jgi:hypothetical protein